MKSTLTSFLKVFLFLSFLTMKNETYILHNFIPEGVPQKTVQQYDDNLRWLREAEKHKMVVLWIISLRIKGKMGANSVE